MTTPDTSERGLELLIARAMTRRTDILLSPRVVTQTSVPVVGATVSEFDDVIDGTISEAAEI